MRSAKQLLAILVCVMLCLPPLFAQEPTAATKVGQDVTIIIARQQVRFAARASVEQMQLQVFNQIGELIFDSGLVAGSEINWAFQNVDGAGVKSGLYAYALAVKEPNAETVRVRRGHFIVDRASERDGADKLWVTSQNNSGVGAELIVAQDETATVAGAAINAERAPEQRKEMGERATNDREAANKTASQTAANSLVPATIGQIVKFTGANNQLGDSVITEANGNIGIGINPTAPLHLGVGSGRELAFGTPNGEVGMSLRVASGNRADLRYNGTLLQLVNGLGGPPPATNGIAINTIGNVGIGTATFSSSRMTIEGPNALTLRGAAPFLTLQDSSVLGGADSFRLQNAAGHLNFLQEVITANGTTYLPRLTIKDNGNVHVGPGNSSIAASRANAVVASNSPDAGIAIAQNSGVNVLLQASGAGGYIGTTSNHPLVLRTNDSDRMVVAPNGDVGVGTGAPETKLHVEGAGIVQATIKSNDERAILVLDSNPAGIAGRYAWTLESGIGGTAGVFGIYDRNARKERLKIFPDGLVSVNSLELRGGSDFSENFDIGDASANGAATVIKPGMLVSINPARPGKLLLSGRAYDRRVVGVISGAGGVKPGVVMGQEGSLADGRHPVALSGRVYAWVDATRGAIKPGDLLTTSPTPGHAMKARNAARAQGAIIGKAMAGLKSGHGLVLVLVTLQ